MNRSTGTLLVIALLVVAIAGLMVQLPRPVDKFLIPTNTGQYLVWIGGKATVRLTAYLLYDEIRSGMNKTPNVRYRVRWNDRTRMSDYHWKTDDTVVDSSEVHSRYSSILKHMVKYERLMKRQYETKDRPGWYTDLVVNTRPGWKRFQTTGVVDDVVFEKWSIEFARGVQWWPPKSKAIKMVNDIRYVSVYDPEFNRMWWIPVQYRA